MVMRGLRSVTTPGTRKLLRQALPSGLLLVVATLGHAGSGLAQQWSIQATDAPARWRNCRIASPAYAGPCRVTFVTKGTRSLNIHFDLDDSGTEGLSFVIASEDLELRERMSFALVAERFQRNAVVPAEGVCSVRPESIRCISVDGAYSAQAVQRLR